MPRPRVDILDTPTAKIVAVLGAVARLKTVSTSALADEIGLAVPTAHRICSELERLGHLQRMPGTREWTVARPLVELAANVLVSAGGNVVIDAILRDLTRAVGEMCSLAVQVGDEVVYVASAEPPHELTLSFRAGRKAPLVCTSSGRLFLARYDDRTLDAYLQAASLQAFTRYSITNRKRLAEIIRRVRAQGFAITNQEYMLHIVGAAVPVLGADGTFFGALSIAAPDVRTSLTQLRGLLPQLRHAATRLADACSARIAAPGRVDARPRRASAVR